MPKILGIGIAESRGLRHGYVTNVRDVADSIRHAIEVAEGKAGVKIKQAFVGVGGIGLASTVVNSTLITSRADAEITDMDLKKIDEAVADFFILCEARSNVQVKAIAHSIEQMVRDECDERPYHIEHGDHWTLVDYVNIVVHIFQHEYREFYNLESLWEDAPRTEY